QPAPAYRSRDSASTVPQRADDGLRPERAAAVALDAVEQLVDDGRRRERHAEPRRGGERETKILLLETHHEARREVVALHLRAELRELPRSGRAALEGTDHRLAIQSGGLRERDALCDGGERRGADHLIHELRHLALARAAHVRR